VGNGQLSQAGTRESGGAEGQWCLNQVGQSHGKLQKRKAAKRRSDSRWILLLVFASGCAKLLMPLQSGITVCRAVPSNLSKTLHLLKPEHQNTTS
jgi:hypothetical protein